MFILLYLMNPLSLGELFVVNVCYIVLTGCIWWGEEQDEKYHRVKQDLSSNREDFTPYLFQRWDVSWKNTFISYTDFSK